MIDRITALLVLTLGFGLAACSPAEDGDKGAGEAGMPAATEESAPTAMDAAPSEPAAIPAHIQAAVDNPGRNEQARARDEGRKPAQVLTFLGIEPGMTVLELGAGGGWYTEILSAAIGPEGKVIAQNSPGQFYDTNIKPNFEPLVARLPNVEMALAPATDLALADNSVDAAFIVLIYHHLNYNADEGEVLPERTKTILAKVRSALKPGGTLAVIEHASVDGASRAESAALHRADDATTVADVTSQGFELAGKSVVLQFESDDRAIAWGGTPHQGKTWRFVHKYVKPAS